MVDIHKDGLQGENVSLLTARQNWETVQSAPAQKLEQPARCDESQRLVIEVHNDFGNFISEIASSHGIEATTVLAVWLALTGWRPSRNMRIPLYVRLHQLFELWGKKFKQEFDVHFRFGGHMLQSGQPWENHEYRSHPEQSYTSVHHNQNSEYRTLTLARVLAGDEVSLWCCLAGAFHVPLQDHESLGFDQASDLYKAMQDSTRTQIILFFDYCHKKLAPKANDLLAYLKQRDWEAFATNYNPESDASSLAAQLVKADQLVRKVLLGEPFPSTGLWTR